MANGNPYYTQPASIMPGLQMLGQGVQRRAGFERERVKSQKLEDLRKKATNIFQSGDTEAIAKFAGENPEAKAIYQDIIGAESDAMLNISKQYLIEGQDPMNLHIAEADRDIAEGRDPAGNIEMARAMAGEKTRGEATKKHESVLAMLDPKAYKAYMSQQGRGGGEVDAAFKKQKTAAYLVKNAEGNTQIIAGVFDPRTGKMVVEGGELPEGYEPVSKLGETGPEESTRKIGQKKGEKIAVSTETRISQMIDRGITAAESTAVLRRGIELLNSVKTGGYSAAALRAKQIFGIESADEGELSNSLGKSVLSQLRETFGAAFTAQEGASLAKIEAAFGKSPGANRRLLGQALALSERTAKRARDAAYKREDMDTVNDINDLLSFTLSDPEQKKKEATGQPQPNVGANVLNFDAQGNIIQ